MSFSVNNESARDLAPLGLELRKLRQARGLSQAKAATLIGLTSRGAIADYESGRRLPPNDILIAYERAFGLAPRHLQDLRANQLAERAESDYQDAIVRTTAKAQVPAATPAEASKSAALSRSRFRPRPAVLWLTATALVTMMAVSGSVSARHKGTTLDPTWIERSQHNADDHAERTSPPENMDGDDPRARDCFADATVVQAVPFTMPDGAPGTLRLRHSNHCGTSWASAYYSNPKLYTVRLAVHRPADGAVVRFDWSNNTPPGSYGDMLSTSIGCVWVEVSVVARPGVATKPVRTDCRK